MHSHASGRLTPSVGKRLIRRHLDEGVPLKPCSTSRDQPASAYKWLLQKVSSRRRSGTGGSAGVFRRRPSGGTLDREQLQQAVDCGTSVHAPAASAGLSVRRLSTVGRLMKGLGLGRLKTLTPKRLVRSLPVGAPGDMIHVDIKQLDRF